MSDKTNDEKLRILQERLAQIKQKQATPVPPRQQREEVIEIATPDIEDPTKDKKSLNLAWVKYVLIIGVLGYSSFYAFNNIKFSNLFTAEEKAKDAADFVLKYNSEIQVRNIAIAATFEDKNSAKTMVNDLKVKGYKCDYFFLPNKSNSTEEVYKVFIGPYENEEETSQWSKNLQVYKDQENTKLVKKREATEKEIFKLEQEKINSEKRKVELDKERKAAEKEKTRLIQEKEDSEKEKAELEQERKNTEEEKISLEAMKLEILKEKESLEQERRKLNEFANKNKIKTNDTIKISYSFKWISTKNNESTLLINNNANYPQIKTTYSNIEEQGGKEEIIKRITSDLNTNGLLVENLYLPKTGTNIQTYKGEIEVIRN